MNMGAASLESLFAQHPKKVNELNKHKGPQTLDFCNGNFLISFNYRGILKQYG